MASMMRRRQFLQLAGVGGVVVVSGLGAAARAADLLGFIGSAADAAVPDLLAACKAPNAALGLHAAVALVQIDPAQAAVAEATGHHFTQLPMSARAVIEALVGDDEK